jgi:hypothetical protein
MVKGLQEMALDAFQGDSDVCRRRLLQVSLRCSRVQIADRLPERRAVSRVFGILQHVHRGSSVRRSNSRLWVSSMTQSLVTTASRIFCV